MSDQPGPVRPDMPPDLLLEASRAFYAAGKRWHPLARLTSAMAVEAIKAPNATKEWSVASSVDPELAAAILCDAAALQLNSRHEERIDRALQLLERVDAAHSEDGGHRLFSLRALARGQLYAAERGREKSPDSLDILAKEIAEDLRLALAGPSVVGRLRPLWQAPSSTAGDHEDDLYLAVTEQEVVRKAITDVLPREALPPSAIPSPRTPPPAGSPP